MEFYNGTKYAVCAWCHYSYKKDTGEPRRHLTDSEYGQVSSHGICLTCKLKQLAEASAERMANIQDYVNVTTFCSLRLTVVRRERLLRALESIRDCEGNLPADLWCSSCKSRVKLLTRMLKFYMNEYRVFVAELSTIGVNAR